MRRYWTYRLRNYFARDAITLPPHLFDRIKASAGEHGGVGNSLLFVDGRPNCVHAHAWGTQANYLRSSHIGQSNPELAPYLTYQANDYALIWADVPIGWKVSFSDWCAILNVKRGKNEDYVKPESSAELQAAS